jgi:hypothetical protein
MSNFQSPADVEQAVLAELQKINQAIDNHLGILGILYILPDSALEMWINKLDQFKYHILSLVDTAQWLNAKRRPRARKYLSIMHTLLEETRNSLITGDHYPTDNFNVPAQAINALGYTESEHSFLDALIQMQEEHEQKMRKTNAYIAKTEKEITRNMIDTMHETAKMTCDALLAGADITHPCRSCECNDYIGYRGSSFSCNNCSHSYNNHSF